MKIYIVGAVASGKTTLARKLSIKHDVSHYEGDCIAWGYATEERYKRTDAEQMNRIIEINNNENWIVEGTDRTSQKYLFDIADTVVFLDTNIFIRLYRIISRYILQIVGIEKSHYKPNLKMFRLMFKWTYDFYRQRNDFEQKILKFDDKLIRIKSKSQLDNFINNPRST